QKSFTCEFRLKDFHDDYRWIVDFGMPYYDFENKFSGYLGSCYDINDRKKYEDTINTLLTISEKLYSSLEIDQISDSLVTESIRLTNAESGFASIKSENGYQSKRYYHKDHWEYLTKTCSADDQIVKRFVSDRNSYISNHADKDSLLEEGLVSKYRIKQILSTPLFDSSGELIGFFELHNKNNNKVFTSDDVNLLKGVARNASISITKSLTYEKLRKTEYQLRSSESELRNLAAQLQYARETERQSIAREVHDELGQLFTGINLNISLLVELLEQNRKPTVSEILNELHSVQAFVNKGIQSVRDISSSLRSYVLDHLGLIPAVQEYCREIERISNITCNFSSELETFNLDDERNVAVFRIIQEALTNVIRHADASLIDVIISQANDNLEINISDNGKGMMRDSEKLSNSMGILGMHERAIFLGGKFNIESIPEQGTRVTLLVPFSQKEKNKV
ncbi:MAG: GAF domain-containing sensor histidine kinase, partial [Bacteroidetes bacterium]|nr:GAF domain-containing sensor histidine kinase [Bacteroidota bacterium]